jgi:hypothetical protein
MKAFGQHLPVIASLLALTFVPALGTVPARSEQYVVLRPGPTCSVKIGDVDLKSFRMLVPVAHVDKFVNRTAIVTVHVCQCLLESGDPQKCALDAMIRSAQRLQVGETAESQLGGRIFIYLTNASEFVNLYTGLNLNYPDPAPALAWQILRNLPPPPPPPPPAVPNLIIDNDNHGKSGQRCHIEPSLCISPDITKPTAEFEVKCEGLPTIVVSTDGKAGLKLGPLEVSISAGGEKH